MKNQTGSVRLIVIIVLVLIALGGAGFYIWQNVTKDKSAETNTSTKTEVPTIAEENNNAKPFTTQATISGDVRYPIEWISTADRKNGVVYPADLKVCAVDVSTKSDVSCDNGFSSNKETYLIAVPAGTYLIKATTGGVSAYYDLYVKDNPNGDPVESCAADTSKPIEVTVKDGDILTKIDAADFWVGHLGC